MYPHRLEATVRRVESSSAMRSARCAPSVTSAWWYVSAVTIGSTDVCHRATWCPSSTSNGTRPASLAPTVTRCWIRSCPTTTRYALEDRIHVHRRIHALTYVPQPYCSECARKTQARKNSNPPTPDGRRGTGTSPAPRPASPRSASPAVLRTSSPAGAPLRSVSPSRTI